MCSATPSRTGTTDELGVFHLGFGSMDTVVLNAVVTGVAAMLLGTVAQLWRRPVWWGGLIPLMVLLGVWLKVIDSRWGLDSLMSDPPWRTAAVMTAWWMMVRPGWLMDWLADGGLMNFPNIVLKDGPMGYADVAAALEQSMVSWADLKWIREAWQGPIVVKGVHIGDDARRAIDEGADAIVVSNHGGRQLDTVAPTIRALPEVVAAANGQIEVLSGEL